MIDLTDGVDNLPHAVMPLQPTSGVAQQADSIRQRRRSRLSGRTVAADPQNE